MWRYSEFINQRTRARRTRKKGWGGLRAQRSLTARPCAFHISVGEDSPTTVSFWFDIALGGQRQTRSAGRSARVKCRSLLWCQPSPAHGQLVQLLLLILPVLAGCNRARFVARRSNRRGSLLYCTVAPSLSA